MRLTRGNKYGAIKQAIDGITFDSKLEASRYLQLKALEQAGEITDLRVHHRFDLRVEGVKVCQYESDFDYTSMPTGAWVVEDCKGFRTAVYRLKKKMFEASWPGQKITEIPAKRKAIRGAKLVESNF